MSHTLQLHWSKQICKKHLITQTSVTSVPAAAAKLLQSCPTLCNPIGAAHQAPQSLGFSRQEHWSGLPFPSPMHESENWKWSCSVASNSLRPRGLHAACQAPPSMGFSRQEYWSGVPLPSPTSVPRHNQMLLQGPVSSWLCGICSNQGSSTTFINFWLYTELCRVFFHSLFFPVVAITANNGHLSDNVSLPEFSSDPLSSPPVLSQSFFKDFFFFNADGFQSLYWICYNIASVLCFNLARRPVIS